MYHNELSIHVRLSHIKEDIKDLLKQFLPNVNCNEVKVQEMIGGTSNILYVTFFKESLSEESDPILFRIYGEIPLDRNKEADNMRKLSKFGLAAEVVGQFRNGVCYKFIHGSVLNIEDISATHIYPLIIKEMVSLHSVKFDPRDHSTRPVFLDKIREFISLLPPSLSDPSLNRRYQTEYPPRDELMELAGQIIDQLASLKPLVTFSHNDLLVKNIVLNKARDRTHFIDFEYAENNYAAFDIANHFNEFAGFENPDYSLYPSETFQLSWIEKYLDLMGLFLKDGSDGDGKRIQEVKRWYVTVSKAALLSHLFWSAWAIWQQSHSNIAGLDYLEYAICRWNEFRRRQQEFMSL